MAKVQNYGLSINVKRQQLQSLEASVDNATKLLQAAHPGIEFMDVLLAQRDLMDAKMVLIETKQQQLAAIVNAYQPWAAAAIKVFWAMFLTRKSSAFPRTTRCTPTA